MDKTKDKTMDKANAHGQKRKRETEGDETEPTDSVAAPFTPIQPINVINTLFNAHTTMVQVQSFLTHLRRESGNALDTVNMNAVDVRAGVDVCIPQLKKEILTMFEVYVRATTDDDKESEPSED